MYVQVKSDDAWSDFDTKWVGDGKDPEPHQGQLKFLYCIAEEIGWRMVEEYVKHEEDRKELNINSTKSTNSNEKEKEEEAMKKRKDFASKCHDIFEIMSSSPVPDHLAPINKTARELILQAVPMIQTLDHVHSSTLVNSESVNEIVKTVAMSILHMSYLCSVSGSSICIARNCILLLLTRKRVIATGPSIMCTIVMCLTLAVKFWDDCYFNNCMFAEIFGGPMEPKTNVKKNTITIGCKQSFLRLFNQLERNVFELLDFQLPLHGEVELLMEQVRDLIIKDERLLAAEKSQQKEQENEKEKELEKELNRPPTPMPSSMEMNETSSSVQFNEINASSTPDALFNGSHPSPPKLVPVSGQLFGKYGRENMPEALDLSDIKLPEAKESIQGVEILFDRKRRKKDSLKDSVPVAAKSRRKKVQAGQYGIQSVQTANYNSSRLMAKAIGPSVVSMSDH